MRRNLIGGTIFILILASFALFPISSYWFSQSLSEITVDDSPPQPWFLSNETAPYVLVYFGYVGCTSICIPALEDITHIYKEIDKANITVPFYFVNLNPTQPKEWVEPFAKSFDKRFHGIYADLNQTELLEKEFNLAVSENNGDMSHSSNVYLFKNDNGYYKLQNIYVTHPFDAKRIVSRVTP